MRYLAIFKDSFRETLDCKTFWVLLAVSVIFILLCWSISFAPLSPEESLEDIAGNFGTVVIPRPGAMLHASYRVTFQAEGPWSETDGLYSFRLRVSPVEEFHRLARHWDAMARGRLKKQDDPVPELDEPADFELERRFLLSRFREQQLIRVVVEPEPAEEGERFYKVELKPSRPELLRGAHRMGIFFGATSFRLPMSAAQMVAGIEAFLADWIAGVGGIIFALVVTASFVPDMLQKGRIDILLSKPIRRPTLMVYKYLGGLLYVLFNGAFLVGGCWLALAARSGHWDPSFLWSIPVLTVFFGILYGFSIWLGVLTRSPIVSILGSMALWFISSSLGGVRQLFKSQMAPVVLPGWAEKAVDFVYYVLPKTSDLKAINNYLIARGNLGIEGVMDAERMGLVPLDWALIALTSAGFLVLCLALACVSFSKRDY